MSEHEKVVVVNKYENAVFWVCALILIILFSGEPDLLDAIIAKVQRT